MLRLLLASILLVNLLVVNTSLAQQLNASNIKNQTNRPLRIAVAANFTPVLEVLLKDFTSQTGINTQVISGASGAMFLQIKYGAPFDIFLSADSRRPKELEQAGYAVKNSRKTYAIGQLALYSPSSDSTTNSLERLNKPPARFAIANPDSAPYGKAAKEALIHLGLWQVYQPRLVKGINIGQTFTQLRSKAVASGIVANSQLMINNLSGTIIPSSYHQAIEQQLIILSSSEQQVAAEQLSYFLLSPASQNQIASYGYAQRKQDAQVTTLSESTAR
ncbi:molybdate ABC transporter substrate-binding protein [Colwellia psychrerythraea]|uniref:Molybdenum ABC transporter, periplasmic molybdate-binding protein n=1 Tax=Colwellia psychrerythraea TaxID=28229 RepID=A0A099KUY2_COLPS|nr:molybdate ABC transporter substrate-binding protein [Colwellia psychrerythraea]KGJ94376.1 molybdenum ABC transporter, periplasmic molybdate-binding protein [Colwellia psychrerythraea]